MVDGPGAVCYQSVRLLTSAQSLPFLPEVPGLLWTQEKKAFSTVLSQCKLLHWFSSFSTFWKGSLSNIFSPSCVVFVDLWPPSYCFTVISVAFFPEGRGDKHRTSIYLVDPGALWGFSMSYTAGTVLSPPPHPHSGLGSYRNSDLVQV